MAWVVSSKGKVADTLNNHDSYNVMTETVTLGVGITGRYTSAFSVPPGVGFTVISNTAATNTSGSVSDQLYVSHDNSTFIRLKTQLRDCNYSGETNEGTSYNDLDTAARVRYVDPDYIGRFPYYKIRALQKGAETSTTTIAFAVILGRRNVKKFG